MSQTLAELQQRLAAIQNQAIGMPLSSIPQNAMNPVQQMSNLAMLSPMETQPSQMIHEKSENAPISKNDLKILIKEILAEIQVEGSNTPQENNQEEITLQDAFLRALSEKDNAWFCTEEIVKELPCFLLTKEGIEVVNIFIQMFKEYHENNAQTGS